MVAWRIGVEHARHCHCNAHRMDQQCHTIGPPPEDSAEQKERKHDLSSAKDQR